MVIQMSIHKNDWSNYEEADKSLCSIIGYKDGNLVYGEGKKDEPVKEDKFNMCFGNQKLKTFDDEDMIELPLCAESIDIEDSKAKSILGFNSQYDLHLKFNNNVKKVVTIVNGSLAGIPEYFVADVGGGEVKRGDSITH